MNRRLLCGHAAEALGRLHIQAPVRRVIGLVEDERCGVAEPHESQDPGEQRDGCQRQRVARVPIRALPAPVGARGGRFPSRVGSIVSLRAVRVIRAGSKAIKQTPLAVVPYVLQALLAAIAVLIGLFPGGPSGAAAAGAFPFGSYFDVKQGLAYTDGWPAFALVISLSILIRGGVLAATLFLCARDRASLRLVGRAFLLTAMTTLLLIPAAGVFFSAVAIRYAPFAWGLSSSAQPPCSSGRVGRSGSALEPPAAG